VKRFSDRTPQTRRSAAGKGFLRGFIVAFAVLALAGGAATLVGVVNGKNREDRMNAIYDSFQIPADWVVDYQYNEPYSPWGTHCNFGATRCPSRSVSYSVLGPVEPDLVLRQLLPGMEWRPAWGDCGTGGQQGSALGECRLEGHRDGFLVQVSIALPAQGSVLDEGCSVRIGIEIDE
jgi:hypothetical protein